MASDYRLISPATGLTVYLVNSSGTATAGGSPFLPSTTPFGTRSEWTPAAAAADLLERGGGPFAHGSDLAWLSYPTIDETIPLLWQGTAGEAGRAVQLLRDQFAALYAQPCLLYCRPSGATTGVYFEILSARVQEAEFDGTKRSPAEGAAAIWIDLAIRRRPFAGLASVETLISAATIGNTGTGSPDNDIAYEASITVKGDLRFEGSPLNVRLTKPTSQSPIAVHMASIYARTYQSIASAKTTSGSTTYTASTAIDVSALRTRAGLKLRVVGRLTSLTSPSNAQVRATVQTASGATLAVLPWVQLGSDTTAQFVDFGATTLDALRVPLSNTTSVIIQGEIKSLSGSVTATLSYIEVLLYYDYCIVECSAALSTSQRLHVLGAQNLAGGGWLPMTAPAALITDGSDAPVRTAVVKGTAPRAYAGASFWIAWVDANGAHTASDTAALTVTHAPQYRSLGSVS